MSLNILISKLKGGAGSGHWNHAGRPGKHGGSSPGRGLSSLGLDKSSTLEDRRTAVQNKKKPVSKAAQIRNYINTNHNDMSEQYSHLVSRPDGSERSAYYKENEELEQAVIFYSTYKHKFINNRLRHGNSSSVEYDDAYIDKKIEAIDKVIEDSPRLAKDTILYRTIRTEYGDDLDKILTTKGAVFQDNGYASTTIDEAMKGSFRFGKTKLVIHAPKGTKGAYIANTSANPDEYEFLLAKGSRFRVMNERTSGSKKWNTIEVELIQ